LNDGAVLVLYRGLLASCLHPAEMSHRFCVRQIGFAVSIESISRGALREHLLQLRFDFWESCKHGCGNEGREKGDEALGKSTKQQCGKTNRKNELHFYPLLWKASLAAHIDAASDFRRLDRL
jgi:hypothetical protein